MSTTTSERALGAAKALLARARTDHAYALALLAAVAGICAVSQTLGTATARMTFPFALEWMEGGVVDHSRRILAGQPLYTAPSMAWTPFIYTPFYYWVCAAFMKVLGVGIFTARLVSTLSLVGCFALVHSFVRKESTSHVAGTVAMGLFAISFKLTGAWMDLARVDSLFLLLLLGGAYLVRFGESNASAALAGVLLFLSFFTKQTGLVLAIPILGAGMGMNRKRGWIAAAVFAGVTLGAVQWADLVSDKWFRYYVFEVPGRHDSAWKEWQLFLHKTLWEPMPVALAFALGTLGSGALVGRWRLAFYGGTLAVAWIHAFTGMLHNGGYLNALIPFCAFLAVLVGIGLGFVLGWETTERGRRFQAIAAGVVLLQFGMLVYDQREYVPRARDRRTAAAVVDRWRQRGDMHSFGFGYYEMLAGKGEIHAQTMALSDVFKTGDRTRTDPLLADIDATLRSGRYPIIVHDESLDRLLPPEVGQSLRRNYRADGTLFQQGEEDRDWPRTAFGCRPNQIWVKR